MDERLLKYIEAGSDSGLCFPVRRDYSFARRRRIVVVGAHEVHSLVGVMPLLLRRVEEQWFLTGVMGILGHGNLLIGPQGGWLGQYVPDNLRLYPLTLARQEAEAELQLAVESDTESLSTGGERQLVDATGEYTELYYSLLKRLKMHAQLREPLNVMGELLMGHGLLQELGEDNVLVRTDKEYFSADMREIPGLPAAALQELAQSGALALGYGMHHAASNIGRFQHMLRRRSGAAVDQDVVQAMQHTEEAGFNFD